MKEKFINSFYRFNIPKMFVILITISSLIYFAYFIKNNVNLISQVANIGITGMSLIILLNIVNLIFISNVNINILRNLNINLLQLESLDLTVKNNLGNLSTPMKLGVGYKLSYLKKNYKFKMGDFLFWNIFYTFFNFIPVGIFYFSYVIINKYQWTSLTGLEIIFVFTIFATIIALILKAPFLKLKQKQFKVISKKFFLCQINFFLSFITTTFIIFIIASNISDNFQFFSSLSYNFLASFVGIVNITPGNLGIKEAVIVIFNEIHNMGTEIVIITSFVERLSYFIANFFLLLLVNARKN